MKLSCYCLLEHLLELAALQERDRASESPVVAAADELALDEYLRHACLTRQCFELGLLGVRYFYIFELDARLPFTHAFYLSTPGVITR